MHTKLFTYSDPAVKGLKNKSSFTSVAVGIVKKFIFKFHSNGTEILTLF